MSPPMISGPGFIETIGDDLLQEILIRLPDSKEAIRCTIVCKRWRSLISHPQFASAFVGHREDAELPVLLLFQRHDSWNGNRRYNPKFHEMLFPTDGTGSRSSLDILPWDNFCIRGSSHNLLLVSRPNTDCHFRDPYLFYICNPMTRRLRSLPELPTQGFISVVNCGFVCSPQDGTYGVALFVVRYLQRPSLVWVTVFSSETQQWSPLALVPRGAFPGKVGSVNQVVACGSGALHWLSCAPDWSWLWGGVASFNPLAGEWRLTPRPRVAGTRPTVSRTLLGVCRGRVRVALLPKLEDSSFALRVWELSRSGWVPVHDAVGEKNDVDAKRVIFPLAHHPSNPAVLFLLCDLVRVCRYDMSERKGRTVGHLPVKVPCTTSAMSASTLNYSWHTPLPSLNFI